MLLGKIEQVVLSHADFAHCLRLAGVNGLDNLFQREVPLHVESMDVHIGYCLKHFAAAFLADEFSALVVDQALYILFKLDLFVLELVDDCIFTQLPLVCTS